MLIDLHQDFNQQRTIRHDQVYPSALSQPEAGATDPLTDECRGWCQRDLGPKRYVYCPAENQTSPKLRLVRDHAGDGLQAAGVSAEELEADQGI